MVEKIMSDRLQIECDKAFKERVEVGTVVDKDTFNQGFVDGFLKGVLWVSERLGEKIEEVQGSLDKQLTEACENATLRIGRNPNEEKV